MNLTKQTTENKQLLDFIKETLGDKVTEVRVSDRLNTTPCVLVTAEFGWTANMERIMKAQAMRNSQMDQFMGARKIMEINPDHNIMKTLNQKLSQSHTNNQNQDKKQCTDIVQLLYDTTLLNSGFALEKPSVYANKVNRMIEIGFCNIDEDEDEEEKEEEKEKEKEEEKENLENTNMFPSTNEDEDEEMSPSTKMEEVD